MIEQPDAQRRIEALVEGHLQAVLAGQMPDRATLVSQHPDLAPELDLRLAAVEQIHRAMNVPPEQPATASEDGRIPLGHLQDQRAQRIKCPHCGNRIQLVEPAPQVEVTCENCGSSFHVDARATSSYRPDNLPRRLGKFELLAHLGLGTFGSVYKARDPELERLVAIKVPRAGYFETGQDEERFWREARAAAGLDHPGIVQVHAIEHAQGLPFIVSDYIEGLTLADRLSGGRPGFRESAELIAQIADAVQHAHQQKVIHRDLKPSNVLLDAQGRPRVADFGLARREEAEITVTLDGQIIGTPAYMSPEQAAGDQKKVDARSDVYSLGVILYELLTGELPFRGNRRMLLHQVLHEEPRAPRIVNDRIPRDLETICLKAMAKSAGRRFSTAAELAADLRRWLDGRPILARPVGRGEKLLRWARRNPALSAASGLLLATLAIALMTAIFFALYHARTSRALAKNSSDLKNLLVQANQSKRDAQQQGADAFAVRAEARSPEDALVQLIRAIELAPADDEARQYTLRLAASVVAQQICPRRPVIWYPYEDGKVLIDSSDDGTCLAIFHTDSPFEVRCWNAVSGSVQGIMRGQNAISLLGFLGTQHVVVLGHKDGSIRFWEVGFRRESRPRVTPAHPVDYAISSPDGRWMLTLPTSDGEPELWDLSQEVATNSVVPLPAIRSKHGLRSLTSDGRVLLTNGLSLPHWLYSTQTGQPLSLPIEPEKIAVCTVAPDGSELVLGAKDGSIHRWDTRNWSPIGRTIRTPSPIAAVEISPDGQAIATRHADLRLRAWKHGALKWQVVPHIGDPAAPVLWLSEGRMIGQFYQPGERSAYDLGYVVESNGGSSIPAPSCFSMHYLGRYPQRGLESHYSRYSGSLYFRVELVPIQLPARLLRLWGQVVLRRDLQEEMTKLSESEWEGCRMRLEGFIDQDPSGLPAVATTDPLYWLRAELETKSDRELELRYLSRLIDAEPNEWLHRQGRASLLAGLGRYDLAFDEMRKARDLGGEDWAREWEGSNSEWFHFALCALAANDMEGYRHACDKYARIPARNGAFRLWDYVDKVWLAGLGRRDFTDITESVTALEANFSDIEVLAPDSLGAQQHFRRTMALNLLRQNRPTDAFDALGDFGQEGVVGPLLAAMAHHYGGNSTEANRYFQMAEERMGRPEWAEGDDWQSRCAAEILRREAESLIAGKKAEAPP